jgi:hypothetical protein
MALRLNEMVTHGVIDNREKGKVIGACWFIGRDSPIRFELIGNCGSDLAGCLVEFINRKPQSAGFLGELPDQVGEAGIITASRMVRAIPADIPLQNLTREALDRWGWIYSLYLEWFNRSNHRVVVEIVDPELRISEPPEEAEGGERVNSMLRAAMVSGSPYYTRQRPLRSCRGNRKSGGFQFGVCR